MLKESNITVWKKQKFTLTWKIFREIKLHNDLLTKLLLISWNFLPSESKFLFFPHCVYEADQFGPINSDIDPECWYPVFPATSLLENDKHLWNPKGKFDENGQKMWNSSYVIGTFGRNLLPRCVFIQNRIINLYFLAFYHSVEI